MGVSDRIETRAAINVLEARKHADRIGKPLTDFVTVNLYHSAVEADEASKTWRAFLTNRYVRSLRRHGKTYPKAMPPSYVWTIENAHDDRLHVHWSVHVPDTFRSTFEKRLEGWLRKEVGMIYDSSAFLNRKKVYNAPGLVNYLLKGMGEKAARTYDIEPTACGQVVGKRVGHAKALGPTAIAAYWAAQRERERASLVALR